METSPASYSITTPHTDTHRTQHSKLDNAPSPCILHSSKIRNQQTPTLRGRYELGCLRTLEIGTACGATRTIPLSSRTSQHPSLSQLHHSQRQQTTHTPLSQSPHIPYTDQTLATQTHRGTQGPGHPTTPGHPQTTGTSPPHPQQPSSQLQTMGQHPSTRSPTLPMRQFPTPTSSLHPSLRSHCYHSRHSLPTVTLATLQTLQRPQHSTSHLGTLQATSHNHLLSMAQTPWRANPKH